ncbi:MAG: hypothetical protein J5666_08990 [Bacilli bacterium]|nr:hypothetical protein [Bacilli bacterium]
MYCVKNKRRNLNSIFEIISCNNCPNFIDDEIILIGRNAIKIYPIFKGCKSVKYDIVSECFSERLSRMLLEVQSYLEVRDDYIFIWSNDGASEFIYNLGLFESFLKQGLNFCIIY